MVHGHADRRKLRRENTRLPPHPKSYITVHPSVKNMCKINSMERIIQYPPLIRVEWSNDWIQIGMNTEKRNFHMSVYPWSAQNHSKLMSCEADFRLNIQPTDLMERYETFLWTQTIQFFQLIVEWVSIYLKSIDKVSEINIKQSVS
jgi:hypothetical protein